jgi:hypothetical protein
VNIACHCTPPAGNCDLKNRSTPGFFPFITASMLHGAEVFKKEEAVVYTLEGNKTIDVTT